MKQLGRTSEQRHTNQTTGRKNEHNAQEARVRQKKKQEVTEHLARHEEHREGRATLIQAPKGNTQTEPIRNYTKLKTKSCNTLKMSRDMNRN